MLAGAQHLDLQSDREKGGILWLQVGLSGALAYRLSVQCCEPPSVCGQHFDDLGGRGSHLESSTKRVDCDAYLLELSICADRLARTTHLGCSLEATVCRKLKPMLRLSGDTAG